MGIKGYMRQYYSVPLKINDFPHFISFSTIENRKFTKPKKLNFDFSNDGSWYKPFIFYT